MLSRLIGFDAEGPVTHVELGWRSAWPAWLLLVLAVAAGVYAAWLYRREPALTLVRRVVLGGLRAGILVLVLVLLFQPVLRGEQTVSLRRNVLVMLDVSDSMNIKDDRADKAAIEEAALALGKLSFAAETRDVPPGIRQAVNVSRIDLAKALLAHPELKLPERLAKDYKPRYFLFGDKLSPTQGEGETVVETLKAAKATAPATRLGSVIDEAVGRYGGQPIAAIVMLTDGAVNDGADPLEVARRMKEKGIPLFPVGIGLPDPPDVRLKAMIVQDTVFLKDRVPVRLQIQSTGYQGQRTDAVIMLDGKEVARKTIELTGGTQFAEVMFTPASKTGTLALQATITPLPGETTDKNNSAEQGLRVIDDKIKVLYVEGKPRWEYRYLRAVLLRDHRIDVKFLMTEGDRDLATTSDRHLSTFPDTAGEAFKFDLVILGDVPASYFTKMQLQRMTELVQKQGGSLLMLAGHEHTPGSYLGSAIEEVIPVRFSSARWENVPDTVCPVMTEAGQRSALCRLEATDDGTAALWALVRPMFSLPVLDGPRGGATVLLELSESARRREPYPLVAWQRYGSGKSMFVGTDQLWRLRFKRGDEYHARFWGQAIQFLTLSRLLGENKRVRIETDRTDYQTGQRVQVFANVLNEAYEPVKTPGFGVKVKRLDGAAEARLVELEAVPDSPGLYQGFFTPELGKEEKTGRFQLAPALGDEAVANAPSFDVTAVPLEQLQPAMQKELLTKMAELSGGKYVPITELPNLPKLIGGEGRTTVIRKERELWDLPLVLGLALALGGVEWFIRRRSNLV